MVECTVNNHTYGDSSDLQEKQKKKKREGNSINNSKILKSLIYRKLTCRFVSNVDAHYVLNTENVSQEFDNSYTYS